MTDEELMLIAARIMDRAERDGHGFHLSSIVDEIRAGIAIIDAGVVARRTVMVEHMNEVTRRRLADPSKPSILEQAREFVRNLDAKKASGQNQ